MEKIIKFAKGIDVVLLILWWLLVVAMGATVLGAVTVFFIPSSFIDNMVHTLSTFNLNVGELSLSLNPSILTGVHFKALAYSLILLVLVTTGLTLLVIRQLRKILLDMKEGRPFSDQMPKHIRMMAYIIFAFAIVPETISSMATFFIIQYMGVSNAIAASPFVQGLGVNLSANIDMTLVLVGFVVLLLAMVFEYGAQLQKQSDETL